MIEFIKFWAKAAIADRKGATALEYALIAAAVAAATMGGFTLFIGRINTFLQNLKFGS